RAGRSFTAQAGCQKSSRRCGRARLPRAPRRIHPRHRWRELRNRRPAVRRNPPLRLSGFPDHFGFFLPLAGITTVKQLRDSSIDIRASSRLNKLYVELLKGNPDWGTAARREEVTSAPL